MDTKGRLVAGSHNRNEFVLVNANEIGRVTSMKELTSQICQICGDEIEFTVDGDPFIACKECAFPVCRPCYEYERREGNQACPQNAVFFFLVKDDTISDTISADTHALIIPPFAGRGKRVHPVPFTDSSMTLPPRPMDPKKDLAVYGYGTVAWKERMEEWKLKQNKKLQVVRHQGDKGGYELDDPDLPKMDEGRQPLSRKIPIPSSKINPYRMTIVLRMAILGLLFHYRILHPVNDAYGLWLTSIICEIWFAVSWIFDQFLKWSPTERQTYPDRLSLRYEKEGKLSELCPVDVFVSTVDPLKEPPLITANTVLSILACDYPVDKVACYVSDDGAAMLTFEALSETSEFARKWVPFCKKFSIEVQAPEWYFAQKLDYLKDKVEPTFLRERRAMKREYEEFKVRINAQIVYLSLEKRPGFDNHKKAGAMNSLIRVSAVISNAPYLFNGMQRDEEIKKVQRENKARVVREGKERRRQWAPKVESTIIETETEARNQHPQVNKGILPDSIVELLTAREKKVFTSDSEDEKVDEKLASKKRKMILQKRER